LSWAHPEFGSIIASASFDRTVKIWEQVSTPESEHQAVVNGPGHSYSSGSSRWVERAVLSDAKGTVRSVEFAPHHFGLKLVSFLSDFPIIFHSASICCCPLNCLVNRTQSQIYDVLLRALLTGLTSVFSDFNPKLSLYIWIKMLAIRF